MRFAVITALLLVSWSCASPESPPATSAPAAASTSQPAASDAARREAPPAPLAASRPQVRGTSFVRGEAPFEWRGITAFRLAEQIAHGRESDAIAFLDWARGQKLTVVRVLLMAKHLFELSPTDGVKALPRLLELAAARDLAVEAVALADTNDIKIDIAQHVKAVATIAAAHPNAVVEIANEPWHPTQDPRLHDPAFVKGLADLVPAHVPVALGSIEGGDGYGAGGTYVTWHVPRSNAADGWGHVLEIAGGAALMAKWQKPLLSDEPIGAADVHVPGRRDNDPRRFGAAAALTRIAGLGATFHYESGLQAGIPAGKELECFTAWSAGLQALAGMPDGGRFVAGSQLNEIAAITGARAAFARDYGSQVWLVAIDPAAVAVALTPLRSEEHTSELQSPC